MLVLKLKEHQSFCLLPKEYKLQDVNNKFAGDKFCGLYYDWVCGELSLKTSYFIGVCWLEKNNLALQIKPKIQNLDFLKMFLVCFKHPKISKELSKIYHINFKQPKIALESNSFEITPLLIIHFLQVVKSIVRKGLKKGYYPVQQNLNAKVKGKINIAKTLKHNVFKAQNHKTVCDYQLFGVDCLENRLLKKALLFVQSYLAKSNIKTDENLKQTLAYCLAPFELVGDKIDIQILKNFKNNAFFREYNEALKLAKMILKRFAYNLINTDTKNLTPPFYINMSLLFEQYVYSILLENNNNVKYQIKGNYGGSDFLVGDMIIDTKYKPKYDPKHKENYDYKIEDIRQLSGYGRDKKIRQKLDFKNNEMAKCLIIYPQVEEDSKDGTENFPNLWDGDDVQEIEGFKNFKKLGVKLPIK